MKLPWKKDRDDKLEEIKKNVLFALTMKGPQATMSDTDPMFPPPTVASVQRPANGPAAVDAGTPVVNLANVPPRDILHHAAVLADKYDDDKQKWLKLADEAKFRIKDLMRENEFLKIEIAELKNNMAVTAAQREECRQRESDVVAVLSNIKTLLDHNEIPLQLRARLKRERPVVVEAEPKKENGNKNGKKAEKKEAVT